MNTVVEFFTHLTDPEGFPPRWWCGHWTAFHGWLYIFSDLAIWAAYFTIPFYLLRLIRKRRDLPFPKIFFLFAAFIFACGTTHLMDALMFWWPAYRLSGVVYLVTAVVSWATIVALIPILPVVFTLKSPAALEKLVEERTRDLQIARHEADEARQAAERANQMKSQFLANMSHELRTPLNAIIGYSQLVANGTAGETTAQQDKYLNYVVHSGQHLLDLINDILDLSRVEAGKLSLQIQPFQLTEMMESLQGLFLEMAAKRNVTLHYNIADDLLEMNADPLRIRQILLNLVSNAIKYNKNNGSVSIRFRNSADQAWIIGEIEDTGIGIPQENHAMVFSQFYQVDNSFSRHQEGAGLGLALTRHLVELHKGTITFQSSDGVGSCFVFQIPVRVAGAVG